MHGLFAALCLPALLSQAVAPQPGTARPAGTEPSVGAKVADRAFAELQKKAYAVALPLYVQALAPTPNQAQLWNEYGICLRNLHRYPAAVRAGWRAIQLDAGHTTQPWTAQANTFMEVREWGAAQACLEKLEALHKDKAFVAKAWLNLAFRMLAVKETAGVVAHCRRATQLDAGNALAWIDLAQALACSGGDAKETLACLAKGQALAERQKDVQQADYAGQLAMKLKAGEAIWPEPVTGRSWQLIPANLLSLPEQDASQVSLPATVEHRYTLEGNDILAMSLPETWTESFDPARAEHLFTVRYAVVGQEGFKAFFSPIKVGNPKGVKVTADDVAKRLLPGSVEKELTPQVMATPDLLGYWLLSTDKKSDGKELPKGAYRHLATFLLDVGRIQCVATVLTNSKAPEVIDPCVKAFGSARKLQTATH